MASRIVGALAALFCCITAPKPLAAQASPAHAPDTGAVNGQVRTATSGAPLADVAVRIQGTLLGTRTDGAGRYHLAGVPTGTHVIVAQRIGLVSSRATVMVRADAVATADFSLRETAISLSRVVVSATREEERKAEVAANVGVVGGDDIHLAKPHHPAEIVGRVPGALVVDLGGEGHTVALRQPITYNPVYAYLEDGIPIRSTGFFNHNALYEINIPGSERIEVIKGPATALYGSDAIGGAFNVLTRPPSTAPSVEVYAEGGRYGYGRALASASNTWGVNGVRADLNVTHFSGWRDEARQNRQSGTIRWDHTLSGGARFKTVATFSNIDSPGDGGSDVSRSELDDRRTVNYTPIAFRKVQALRLSTAYESRSEQSLLSLTAYGRYNRLNLLPNWQLTYDPQVWDSRNGSLGMVARYRRTLPPLRTSVAVGVDADYSPGERIEDQLILGQSAPPFTSYTVGERQYDYDVTFRGVSPYVQVDATPVAGLHLSAGLRYDQVGYAYTNHLSPLDTGSHRRPPSTSVSYGHLSPKAGVTYEFSDAVNAFASYRHGFRVPSESQLFVQRSATNTVDLEPVRANSYEVGLRARVGERASLETSAYTMEMTDDILSFFNTTDSTSETSNAGRSRHWGIEAGLTVLVSDALRVESSYTYARHRYLEWVTATGTDYSGNDMESGPRHIANARVTYAHPRRGAFTLEWVHVGGYFTDPGNEHQYGGHDLMNFYANARIAPHVTLVGRVNNLADVRYANTALFNPFVPANEQERFTPGLPRSLFLGLQYSWTGLESTGR